VHQHLCRNAFLLANQPKKQVLRSHCGSIVVAGTSHRKFNHFLYARCVGPRDSCGNWSSSRLDGCQNHPPDGIDIGVQVGEESHGRTVSITEQCQEDVLGADVFMVECSRFVAGGVQCSAGYG